MSHLLCRLLRLSASLPLMFVLGEAHAAAQAQTQPPKLPDYTHGASAFPAVLSPYQPGSDRRTPVIRKLAAAEGPDSRRSPAAFLVGRDGGGDRERSGSRRSSRSSVQSPESTCLRTSSGQAARGVPGALLPSGLSAGALGVGVNQGAGPGGVGNAGGISGGGGAVQVGQVGTFDPAVSFSTSYGRTSSPLNSIVVAGVPQVTTASSAGASARRNCYRPGQVYVHDQRDLPGLDPRRCPSIRRWSAGWRRPQPAAPERLWNASEQTVPDGAANNVETSSSCSAAVRRVVAQVERASWDLTASRQAIAAARKRFKRRNSWSTEPSLGSRSARPRGSISRRKPRRPRRSAT